MGEHVEEKPKPVKAEEPKAKPLEYPKMLYKQELKSYIVKDPAEQRDAEADGWKEKV